MLPVIFLNRTRLHNTTEHTGELDGRLFRLLSMFGISNIATIQQNSPLVSESLDIAKEVGSK